MTLRPQGWRVALVYAIGLLAVWLGGSVRLAWSQVALAIPRLPPGKSIIVTIDATVNTSLPFGVMHVSAQGSMDGVVGGVPFTDLLTDDPAGAGQAPRPTVTPLDVPDFLLSVTLGAQNPAPQPPFMLSLPIHHFAVLQAQVRTGVEEVDLTSMTLDLTDLHGNETLLRQLRLSVFDDANGNGRVDANEVELVSTPTLAAETMLRLTFRTPLPVPAHTETHLLVVLTSTGSHARLVPLSVLPPGLPPWLGLGLGLAAVVAAYGWRRRSSHRRLRMGAVLLLCTLGCGLVLTSCDGGGDGGGDDVLTATVMLPVAGITGDSALSGLVDAPTTPLQGASVIILP